MTFGEESGARLPSARTPEAHERDVRWWLVAALVAVMGMAVLFLRSYGPFDKEPGAFGTLRSIELLPIIALAVLVVPGGTRFRPIGAIVAYAAALNIAFVSFAGAIFPGGSPDKSDPLRPALLDSTQSLIGVTIASAAVMVCASLYARGRARVAVNVCTVVLVATFIVLKTLIYR